MPSRVHRLLHLLLLVAAAPRLASAGPLPTRSTDTTATSTITVTITATTSNSPDSPTKTGSDVPCLAGLPGPALPGHIPRQDAFSSDVNKKKIQIILIVLAFSVVGAVILSVVNIHQDRMEMHTFYKGYMGRRLLLTEHKLLCRDQDPTAGPPGVKYIRLEPVGAPGLGSPEPSTAARLGHRNRYVEDEEPEWRSLDYSAAICPPPSSFLAFTRQYNLGIFGWDHLSGDQVERRQNLLLQFRRWKKRKRKTFLIVVTEKGRRELQEQEESKNKKRTPH